MLTILNTIFTLATSALILTKESIFTFFAGLYAASKTSLGIAVPLVAI